MAMITLKEWASRVGIDPSRARHKALDGKLPAVKMGRDWFIEEATENIDGRVKTGKYKNWRNSKMKDYKLNIISELEKLTAEYHAVMLRRAALNVGINHLKTQEAHEVMDAFVKAHPEFKIYELSDNPHASFFCAAFVSDNETPPLDPEARV